MSPRHLGGLLAAVLAGAVLVATPRSAQARPPVPEPRGSAARAAEALIRSRAPELLIGRHDGFVPRKVLASGELRYAPYERTYRGLPVVGGDFVVLTDTAGHVLATSVAQSSPVRLATTTPRSSAARAIAVARHQVSRARTVQAPELVVWQASTSHLAWETVVSGRAHGHRSVRTVYVDARSGKLLASREQVLAGNGDTAYAGTVSFPTTLSGSTYSMRHPGAPTLTCQDWANNTTFSGPDDLWGNGMATNRETGCADAYYAADQERLMLSSWLGRNGMTGSGGWVPIRVGLDDVNADYDGTQVEIGHNLNGGWVGSLDVVAHEFGHGVDDWTPGGISGGGTQEFVADAFGAATEWYANNPVDRRDFLVGEQVDLVGQGPIRNMYNPAALGDPSCYSSSIPNTEVHAAAGPGDHWFYLLAEGSNPTDGQPPSQTCNGSNVTGVGVPTAMRILYNAMLMKTSTSSYLKYRTWTLTAAKNLDPSCALFNRTKAAWDAVSVPAQAADPTCGATSPPTVTNPGGRSGTVGTPIASFTLSASGGTAPYTWSATGLPPGISVGPTTGTLSGTPTTAGTFSVTATATGSGGSGSGSTTFTFTVAGGGGGGGGGGACSGQRLGNPGFETGSAAPWSASFMVVDSYAGAPAHSGTWKAWLDGYGSAHTDTLSQSVTIPAGCHATFSYWLHVESSDRSTTARNDTLTVRIGSTTLATYSNLDRMPGYQLRTFDVSAFAGQTVTISFTGTENDDSLPTSFMVDDTAVNL